jgi:hypothetical protein
MISEDMGARCRTARLRNSLRAMHATRHNAHRNETGPTPSGNCLTVGIWMPLASRKIPNPARMIAPTIFSISLSYIAPPLIEPAPCRDSIPGGRKHDIISQFGERHSVLRISSTPRIGIAGINRAPHAASSHAPARRHADHILSCRRTVRRVVFAVEHGSRDADPLPAP